MDQDHQERIRQRAHEIWETEGRPEGRDADHWSQAEQELRDQSDSSGQTADGDQSSGQGGEAGGDMADGDTAGNTIQSPDTAQTAGGDKPKSARRASEKQPTAEKKPRKSTKSASAASTPYLNDGP